MPEKLCGTVVWFNSSKGYGFIHVDGSPNDVFVHHTEIQMEGFRDLQENDQVEFETGTGPNGLIQAKNVIRLQDGTKS